MLKVIEMKSDLRIHLLMSVFLTDVSLTPPDFYGKKKSPSQNKINQFLSTIHSLEILKFSSADIFFDLSSEYEYGRSIIEREIVRRIPNAKVHTSRLETYADWKNTSDAISEDSDLILLKTNHDHVFLPQQTSSFFNFLAILRSFGHDIYGEVTHWPESIATPRSGKWHFDSQYNYRYLVSECEQASGTCVVSTKFFKSWWKSDFTDGKRIVRPDNPFGPSVKFEAVKRIVPSEEFFRHLDGYGHAKVRAPIAAPLRACCSLVNDSVEHVPWIRGNFLIKKEFSELPIPPIFSGENPISTLLNQVLLVSAYKVILKNIYHVARSHEYRGKIFSLFTIPLVFLNHHFLQKLINIFLPIAAGNYPLYRLRLFYVTCYQKLRLHYPRLPSSLRGIFLRRR